MVSSVYISTKHFATLKIKKKQTLNFLCIYMYIYYDNKWSLIIKDSCVYISNKHFVTLKIKKKQP